MIMNNFPNSGLDPRTGYVMQRRKGARALPIRNRDSVFASLRLCGFALKNVF